MFKKIFFTFLLFSINIFSVFAGNLESDFNEAKVALELEQDKLKIAEEFLVIQKNYNDALKNYSGALDNKNKLEVALKEAESNNDCWFDFFCDEEIKIYELSLKEYNKAVEELNNALKIKNDKYFLLKEISDKASEIGLGEDMIITEEDLLNIKKNIEIKTDEYELAQLKYKNDTELLGTPKKTIEVGEEYSFTPEYVGLNGNKVEYSIINKPNWLNFNKNTGKIYGTPTVSDSWIYKNIQISAVSNGKIKKLPAFDIEVINEVGKIETSLKLEEEKLKITKEFLKIKEDYNSILESYSGVLDIKNKAEIDLISKKEKYTNCLLFCGDEEEEYNLALEAFNKAESDLLNITKLKDDKLSLLNEYNKKIGEIGIGEVGIINEKYILDIESNIEEKEAELKIVNTNYNIKLSNIGIDGETLEEKEKREKIIENANIILNNPNSTLEEKEVAAQEKYKNSYEYISNQKLLKEDEDIVKQITSKNNLIEDNNKKIDELEKGIIDLEKLAITNPDNTDLINELNKAKELLSDLENDNNQIKEDVSSLEIQKDLIDQKKQVSSIKLKESEGYLSLKEINIDIEEYTLTKDEEDAKIQNELKLKEEREIILAKADIILSDPNTTLEEKEAAAKIKYENSDEYIAYQEALNDQKQSSRDILSKKNLIEKNENEIKELNNSIKQLQKLSDSYPDNSILSFNLEKAQNSLIEAQTKNNKLKEELGILEADNKLVEEKLNTTYTNLKATDGYKALESASSARDDYNNTVILNNKTQTKLSSSNTKIKNLENTLDKILKEAEGYEDSENLIRDGVLLKDKLDEYGIVYNTSLEKYNTLKTSPVLYEATNNLNTASGLLDDLVILESNIDSLENNLAELKASNLLLEQLAEEAEKKLEVLQKTENLKIDLESAKKEYKYNCESDLGKAYVLANTCFEKMCKDAKRAINNANTAITNTINLANNENSTYLNVNNYYQSASRAVNEAIIESDNIDYQYCSITNNQTGSVPVGTNEAYEIKDTNINTDVNTNGGAGSNVNGGVDSNTNGESTSETNTEKEKEYNSNAPSVNCIGLPGCVDTDIANPTPASKKNNLGIEIVSNIIGNIIQFVAVIAVIALILSGILYLVSGGEEEKVKTAKSWITWSLVGVILSISAWGIIEMLNKITIG